MAAIANGQEGERPAATSIPPQPHPPTSPPPPPTTATAAATTASSDFVPAPTKWSERAKDEDDHEQSEKPTAPLSPKPSPSSNAAAPNMEAANPGSIIVNRSTADGFAVIAKPAQSDTHFSVADVLGLPMEGGEAGSGRDSVGGGSRRRGVSPIVRRWNREKVLRRAGLAFRVCGLLFSLVSFSVMAVDKTQGWSGDSFYRYKEYRYVISVAVITFAYSTLQLAAHLYQFTTRKPAIRHPLSLYIDFACDQMKEGRPLHSADGIGHGTTVSSMIQDEYDEKSNIAAGDGGHQPLACGDCSILTAHPERLLMESSFNCTIPRQSALFPLILWTP